MQKHKQLVKYKLGRRGHSGRLRPHEYTSYAPLALMLMVVGIVLLGATVFAATPYNGPEAGSVGLSGTMPAPPPKTAATIVSPANGQHFSTSPISVAGSCPANTLVEVFKNDIFAGSTPCSNSGDYSFQIDLLLGQNTLIARVYDALNQPGPDSAPVTVFYDAVPAQSAGVTPLNFGGSQLLLSTDAVYRGVFPGHPLNMPIQILGGTPPYALNIQWGDNSNSIISRSDNLTFNATHTYHRPGTYPVILQATDAQGRVAFLSVTVIVNGSPAAAASSTSGGTGGTNTLIVKVLVLWPLYLCAVVAVTSFWLGERREKHILLTRPAVAYHI